MADHSHPPAGLRGSGGHVQVATEVEEHVLLRARELGRMVTAGRSRVLLPHEVGLDASEIGVLGYGPLRVVFGRRSTRALKNENAHSNPDQAPRELFVTLATRAQEARGIPRPVE
jgi:hypothetical protein